jgi:peptide/nickel transport system substrate-binding protein
VRQAIAYAVDRQRLVDTALYGFGRPAAIFWPRQSIAYDVTLERTGTFDLAKARQLLTAAHWDTNATITLFVANASFPTQAMAEILQQDLARIGVQAVVQKVDAVEFLTRLQKGQMGGAWITNVGFMNQSPATFFLSAFAVRTPNSSHFESSRYTQLIDLSRTESDDQNLKTQMRELTQIMLDEAFVVPIAETASKGLGLEAAHANVKGVTWNNSGSFAFQDIWLDQ